MITLSILSDFCNYWWFWWIMPFVLGCLLSYSVMKKWRSMHENQLQTNRKQKNKIFKSDSILNQYKNEVQDLKGQLAIKQGKINELEIALKDK